jgi:hypothetical protein
LGRAAENIILAVKNVGYDTELKINKDDAGVDFISTRLYRDSAIQKDDLFEYIDERQVTRNAYDNTSIAWEDLKKLNRSSSKIEI